MIVTGYFIRLRTSLKKYVCNFINLAVDPTAKLMNVETYFFKDVCRRFN